MWYGKDGNSVPRRKTYLNEREGAVAWTWWNNEEVGHSQEGKKDVISIFNDPTIFDTPKPVRLINRILQLYTNTKDGDIILDSFAGSGTTAHATLKLNKQDGGNRQFILVEMEEYSDKITAERAKRVINGYGENGKTIEGTGGSFDFYELGKPLFLDNEMLNEEVGLEKIREYVWFSETRKTYQKVNDKEEHLLGVANSSAFYFYYYKDRNNFV